MKYFKHPLHLREEPRTWRLIKKHGMTGYGVLWALYEELYKAEDDGFQIQVDDLWLEQKADEYRLTDELALARFIDAFVELGFLDKQAWQERLLFSVDVIDEGNAYIQQKVRNAERQRQFKERKKNDGNALGPESNTLPEQSNVSESQSHTKIDLEVDLDVEVDPERGSRKTETETENPETANAVPTPSTVKVEILEPEAQPSNGTSLDSKAITLPAKSKRSGKGKNSAPRRQKTAPVDTDAWRDAYNALRPTKWSKCTVLSPERLKAVHGAIRLYSGDEQEALRMFRLSLAFIRVCQDPYWREWDNGEFLTPLRKQRFTGWAEKAIELNLNPDAVAQSGMSDRDMRLARFMNTPSPWDKKTPNQSNGVAANARSR